MVNGVSPLASKSRPQCGTQTFFPMATPEQVDEESLSQLEGQATSPT